MEKNVDLVLKPCYSRFATQTIIKPSGIQDKQLQVVLSDVKKGVHWVGQHYVHGKHYCSYSIAHEGRVTAHACYPSEFTPGRVGATMVFESVKHNLIQDWVASFVKVNNLTGQYAFDFIEAKDSVYVLECNPRSSSGIHLFADQPEFTDSILDPTSVLLLPLNHQPLRQISVAMVVGNYFSTGGPGGFVKGQFFEELQRWITVFLSAHDVVFDITDVMPFIMQFVSAAIFTIRGKKKIILLFLSLSFVLNCKKLKGFVNGVSPVQSTTLDIEWNGN